jgi:DNA-binding GntR family transcriptional regulator
MNAAAAVAAAVRARILDGELDAGARLVEQDLAVEHDAARHTVRAALRELQGEGLVTIEPNRGARVATLGGEQVIALHELRAALEVEAAHLALARHDGHLPRAVHDAAAALAEVCARRPDAPFAKVTGAHAELHGAIVRASRSPRIIEAHRRLDGELRLFLVRIRPHWTLEELAAEHLQLVADLEAQGPEVLRPHLRESAEALVDRLEGVA